MSLTKTQQETLWEAVKDIKTGMLTTINGETLRSRPMEIVQEDFDGSIYLYTKRVGAKVDELLTHPDACLSFCDHKNHEHVSVSGSCTISHSEELISRYWSPFVSAWFPDGKESAAIIVLEVEKAEIWDSEASTMKVLYEIARANLTGTKPDIGENTKLG